MDPCGIGNDPCAVRESNGQIVKGEAVTVFRNQTAAALSDKVIDVTQFNAVSVQVFVSGTNPSATVSLEGAPEQGANYLALADGNASQAAVTSSQTFDAEVPSAYLKVRLADVSGTFGKGQGFTVIVTPYISPGASRVTAVVQ